MAHIPRPTTGKDHTASANPKRVLMLLTNAFDPDPRVHQEAKTLVKNEYDVTILCWDRDFRSPIEEIVDGIKIERVYVRSTHGRGTTQMLFLFLFWCKAYFRAVTKRYDILHCHDFDTLPLGYILSRKMKAMLVYDSHESYVDMLGNLPGPLRWFIYRGENVLLKRADLVITVGEILRRHLDERGAKKSCVVGNWKDLEEFEFSDEVLESEKRNLRISKGQVIISFISNLGKERQLPQLVGAVAETPQFFLIIGGDGPCASIAADAAQRYPNIVYLGRVPPSEVPLYTALSDIVCYGFDRRNPNAKYSAPNKLFEGLAAGKAILTGDFGEIARIVREAQCGLTLRNFSEEEIKVALLQMKPDKLRSYKDNALTSARIKYNWKHSASTLLENYCTLS